MINPISKLYDYVSGVESGEIVVCNYVKLAVQRFQNDLLAATEKGFLFDEEAAQKALDFFELLRFTKGKWKGKAFDLQPWQCFIVANIFGWKRLDDGNRRFTEVYVEICKKNGKTELAAAIGLIMLVIDEENTPEVYAAAATRDQAGICFKAAKSMARQSEYIRPELDILTYSLYCDYNEGTMSAVSHDADNTEGKHSSCVLFDEYHVHKTDDVKTSLRSGMAAREQPLFFTITTSGSNKQGPCYKYRGDCISILKGFYNRENLFTVIYTLDEGDDWEDPNMWRKANPNYGVSVRPQFLQEEYEKAKKNGREEVEFKTKHLDLWVDSDVTWLASELWAKGADPNIQIPADAVCYAAVDLGETSDFTAYSKYFPEYNFVTTRYYVPEDTAEYASRHGIDYKEWAEDEFLTLTPGCTTDYEWLKQDIYEDASNYDMRFISLDPWHSAMLKQDLENEMGTTYAAIRKEDGELVYDYHSKVQTFKQAAINMSPPTKLFEEMVMNTRLKHDGNPVSAWQLANVALHTDPIGNIRPDKKKSRDKIDGIVSKIMALGTYVKWHIGTENYANSGFTGII
ncbi:terminase large subunit [Dyadobacter chenwenxiniae]|uniref:Terminase large subunit n=1 Tax=Dyadobacter chenwenxiniae TaxID=2906456 RepID=A0A9X1TCW7_9BACT|nr:terminase TerL endonuclease subunit [Dyadobacter chenwenxiniae]MCF0060129.1 terminase large subunit [Dyadobacter chenwenxiniae]UON85867.1 terminase large subunit [Dyadobacter chenwenxiniae]